MGTSESAVVLPFAQTRTKSKISFDIYQAVAGGMVSIDAVVPEHIAAAFLQLLRSELLI